MKAYAIYKILDLLPPSTLMIAMVASGRLYLRQIKTSRS